MYKIKEKPGDFVVEEVTSVIAKKGGKYSLWWMTKKDYTTVDAVGRIARALRIKDRFVGFAGTKDRRAITKQVISISMVFRAKVEKLEFDDIKLEFYGYSDKPVSLGDLEGNKFKIVVRNLDEVKEIEVKKVKNFFGEQRFSKQNTEIGRAIVKKDFESAARKIAETEKDVRDYLEDNKTDFIGALRKVPKKILKIYAHSYQSLLWNKIAGKVDEDMDIPLIGFDTEIQDMKIKETIEELMKEEGLTYRDFIIKEIPELSAEGRQRRVFVRPEGFEILEKGDDELNKGKYKLKISFFLPKGSYATEVIRQLFANLL